jgi:hypothetical protein
VNQERDPDTRYSFWTTNKLTNGKIAFLKQNIAIYFSMASMQGFQAPGEALVFLQTYHRLKIFRLVPPISPK